MADDANPIRRRNFLMGAGTALAATMAAPAAPAVADNAPAATSPGDEPTRMRWAGR